LSNKGEAIIGIAFGIGAGLSYGVSSVLIKYGVGSLASPLVGAAVSLLSGTLGLSILGARGVKTDLSKKKGIIFMLLAGVTAACGVISSFFALSMAPVVLVSPVQSTNPLFALLWSYLFLGRLERITPRLILGSVLVVTGVILITLGRAG
jgi:drug/metabolite transporter (DMT)-like permease